MLDVIKGSDSVLQILGNVALRSSIYITSYILHLTNVCNSEPKKNFQKTFEFFQKLKCSNPTQKTSIEPQFRDPPRL